MSHLPFLVAAFSFVSSISLAATPDQIVAKVQSTYSKAGTISAQFTQTRHTRLRKHNETGKIWAAPDGKVRWIYESPTRKDFIYDGEKAYFYEPEDSQVTVFKDFRDSALSQAVSFMLGRGELAKFFRVEACKGADCKWGKDDGDVVALHPIDPIPTVDHVLLVVNSQNRVVRSVVVDPLSENMEYTFDEVKFGVEVPASRFQFEIPKGVQVLKPTLTDPKKKDASKRGAGKPSEGSKTP